MKLSAVWRLVPSFVAPAISALIGAGVGGYITQDIVIGDTRTRLLESSYSSYLAEATRSLPLSDSNKLTEGNKENLQRATAVLMLSASEDVLCRAFEFEKKLGDDGQHNAYLNLAMVMREEIGVADTSNLEPSAECSFVLFDF